jgi:hypothetical protein
MENGGVRSWLLNTFAVNNLIKAFNQSGNIPTGQNEQLIKDAYQYLVYKSNTISERYPSYVDYIQFDIFQKSL